MTLRVVAMVVVLRCMRHTGSSNFMVDMASRLGKTGRNTGCMG